ncbi:MAG TPA: hypothetical protein VMU75_04705 [Acidimicrobiales bacterium]|nr:hypothetical protein [Acidimicrobiales bacterium]
MSGATEARRAGSISPSLRLPREPERLRRELRELAGEDPAAAKAVITKRLTERLWRAWRPELAPRGGSSRALRNVIAADGVETWLWVLGDRRWDQLVEGLAGRVARRV